MFKLRMRLLAISMSLATSAAFASVPFVVPTVQAAPAQVTDQTPFSFSVPCFPDLPALPSLPCFSNCVTPNQETVVTETPTPTSNLIPRVQSTPTPTSTLTPRVQSTPTPTPTPAPTATPTPAPTATPTPAPTATPTPAPTATSTPTPTPNCECNTPTSADNSTNYDNGANNNSDVFNQMQGVFNGYGN